MTEEKKSRRCYENGLCPYHNILQSQVEKSLPRWVFVSAFATMITLAIIFAGWHVNSIAAFDDKYKADVIEFNKLARENKVEVFK